jgi:hypothetical protein
MKILLFLMGLVRPQAVVPTAVQAIHGVFRSLKLRGGGFESRG